MSAVVRGAALVGRLPVTGTTPLGSKLRTLRLAASMTQFALANASGVDATNISQIERGETRAVRQRTMLKLAKGLGVRPKDLSGAL